MAFNKQGLSYYNVDTDRYQDIRIKKLKKGFGTDGIAVYDFILCEVYRVKGCFLVWDESTVFDVADYFNMKETLIKEIVNYCAGVGLFNKAVLDRESVITSQSIQGRYLDACIRSKRKNIKIPEKYMIPPEECKKTPEEIPKIPEEINRVEESKVKESKGEERNAPNNLTELLGIVVYNAEELIQKNQIRFEQICTSVGATLLTAKDSLHKYHLHLEEKELYPKSKKALYAGFEKWLRNEKNFSNGQQNIPVHQSGPELKKI